MTLKPDHLGFDRGKDQTHTESANHFYSKVLLLCFTKQISLNNETSLIFMGSLGKICLVNL